MAERRISLVLSSGGARGLAHIGVLRCLEKHGYEIDYISGSSIGALIGGVYAAGKLDIYADWVSALTRRDVMRLLDWSFTRGALFKGERIIEELKKLIGDVTIEELDIGFTAVAADLNTEREVWLSAGPLWDSIRASIAVPLVFAPVERGAQLLVDGGLINPVPIAPTFNSQAPTTFAVDLNARARGRMNEDFTDDGGALVGPATAESESAAPIDDEREAERIGALSGLPARIRKFIDRVTDDLPTMELRTPQALDLALASMETMQSTISRMKLAAYAPQVLISVPRNLASFFDFHRAGELIEYGYVATERALDRARR
jgi:NTE family protein